MWWHCTWAMLFSFVFYDNVICLYNATILYICICSYSAMLSEDAWNNMRTSTHTFFVWMHMHARKCSQWVWTHSKLCLYSCFLYSTLILDLRFILMCTWCHKTREGGVLENQGYSSSRVFLDFHWEFILFPFILISVREFVVKVRLNREPTNGTQL